MIASYKIIFPSGIPSLTEIWKKLQESTGLNIQYDNYCREFINPEDPDDVVPVCFNGEQEVELIVPSGPFYNYLLAAMLKALVELGGSYKGYIPSWASLKWSDVNQNLEQLSSFTFPKPLFN
jgi:hypothetical protein